MDWLARGRHTHSRPRCIPLKNHLMWRLEIKFLRYSAVLGESHCQLFSRLENNVIDGASRPIKVFISQMLAKLAKEWKLLKECSETI